jgi:hypothetical protein
MGVLRAEGGTRPEGWQQKSQRKRNLSHTNEIFFGARIDAAHENRASGSPALM